MAHRWTKPTKNKRRIDPRYFLEETATRGEEILHEQSSEQMEIIKQAMRNYLQVMVSNNLGMEPGTGVYDPKPLAANILKNSHNSWLNSKHGRQLLASNINTVLHDMVDAKPMGRLAQKNPEHPAVQAAIAHGMNPNRAMMFTLKETATRGEELEEKKEKDAGSDFLKSRGHDPETGAPFKGTKTKRGAAKHQRRKEKLAGKEIEDLEEERDPGPTRPGPTPHPGPWVDAQTGEMSMPEDHYSTYENLVYVLGDLMQDYVEKEGMDPAEVRRAAEEAMDIELGVNR